MKLHLLIATSLLLLASCTIKQQFYFEDDFSGKYKVDLDLSAVSALVDEGNRSWLHNFNKDSMIEAMNRPSGLSDAFIEEKDNDISFGYNFNNIGSLSDAQKDAAWGVIVGQGFRVIEIEKPMFVVKGKKLFYNPPKFDDNDSEPNEMTGMEDMSNMMRYEVVMNFEKPIKKINNENWILSNGGRTATFSVGYDELKTGQNGAAVIKF